MPQVQSYAVHGSQFKVLENNEDKKTGINREH